MSMKLITICLTTLICGYSHAQNQVFFGNLHSHTSYSDGSATPEDAYRHARDIAKVHFLAITEHNHPGAGKIANDPDLYSGPAATSLISTAGRFNQDNQFVAIFGQEFSSISSGNHANIFELSEVINSEEVPNGRWDLLMNNWLHTRTDPQGRLPLMLLNHPAISSSPNEKEYGRDDFPDFNSWIARLDNYAKLINMVNGPSHNVNGSPGRPSEREFLRYLNMGLHVAPTADQDNHQENWGDAANTRTAVIAPSLTKANILDALYARHVYATEDKNLSVIATINGHLIGSILTGNQVPANNSKLTIQLAIKDADEPGANYTIDIYRDNIGGMQQADVIHEVNVTGDTAIAINNVKYTGGRQYFFIKITQTDDDAVEVDQAWLAPVWFEPGAPSPATPGNDQLLTLAVNERTEEAVITNIGNTQVNLKNWVLVSTVGNQRFTFTTARILQPGQSIIITSGPNATTTGNHIRWTTNYIWGNDGDPGQLLDARGNTVATSSN